MWKDLFFQLRDAIGHDLVFSNHYIAKMIAESKKNDWACKNTCRNAQGRVRSGCHMPSEELMAGKDVGTPISSVSTLSYIPPVGSTLVIFGIMFLMMFARRRQSTSGTPPAEWTEN